MGKTYRRGDGKGNFDEDRQAHRKGKHSGHPNNKKSGGMKVINEPYEDDDYFDDEVQIRDTIVINKFSDDSST